MRPSAYSSSRKKLRDRLIAALAAFVLLAATAVPALAAPGNVLSEQKISDTAGGFSGALADTDLFGASVAALGDLDGDGVTELAVGAVGDDDGGLDRGAVWVLFMTTAGTVASSAKISDTAGGFIGALANGDQFGSAVAAVGDLDGDGVADVAVGAQGDDDGGSGRGAVWILFLNSNGTVKGHQKISGTVGAFAGSLSNGDAFGNSVASLGDLDGDGIVDLAVGAPGDDDGGNDRGAAWLLFLNGDGTVKSHAKISELTAGFGGSLADGDAFGFSVAGLRDLDGDGVDDLAVGAAGDGDGGLARGAVWVLFLDTNGSLKGSQKISDISGGFAGILDNVDQFGSSLASLRDLDANGVDDLAVGAIGDDDGGPNRGAVWILLLKSDGTVNLHRKISATSGGFGGILSDSDNFGTAAAMPRDLDGDGVADLVVGARRDDDGGLDRGAAWVLFLDGVPGAFCGDGVLDPGEACDDGNSIDGDCCSSSCSLNPPGTSCADGDLCNGDETCDGSGNCQAGTPLVCDDGDPCTQDSCDAGLGCQVVSGPAPVCSVAGKTVIDIVNKTKDNADKISWKWTKGAETLLADLGDPTATTEYALCIYDYSASVPSLATKVIIPPASAWISKGSKGFQYKDKTATFDGAKIVVLKPGVAGKAKVRVFAKGVNLPAPTPVSPTQFFNQDPNVTVQLLNDLGNCWTSEFTVPPRKNDGTRFKDKAQQ